MQHHHAHAGLSMVETIISITVLAILITLSLPTLGQFFDHYRERQEQATQLAIHDALIQFAETYNTFPNDDPALNPMCGTGQQFWYDCLQPFTNLTATALRFDIWDEERAYLFAQEAETLIGTTFQITAVSVHSKGLDRQPGADTLIPTNGDDYANTTHADWWANRTNPLSQFEILEAVEDDIFIKLTDQILKLEKFETTRQRLEDIRNAIVALENRMYTQEIIINPATVDLQLHVPPSTQTTQANPLALWSASIQNEVAPYTFPGSRIDNRDGSTAQRQTRRDHMVRFMRLLGLPDGHCCNALEKDRTASASGNDYTQDRPFFYYANPRVSWTGGVCQNRATLPAFAPAKVTINSEPCG